MEPTDRKARSELIFNPSQHRDVDPLPPHSIEAEMCLLGSVMLSGNNATMMHMIRAVITEDDFFQADHQILYRVICEVSDRCGCHDAVLVREELNRRQILEDIGGTAYLSEILRASPSRENGPHYAKEVRNLAVLRRIIAAATEALRRAYAPMIAEGADDIARDFMATLHGVSGGRGADTIVRIDSVIDSVIDSLLAGHKPRLRTGITDLDGICGGLPINGYTVIAGRPSMGKSQVGKQIIANIARGQPAVRIDAVIGAWGDVLEPERVIAAQEPRVCGIVTVEETLEKIGQNYLSAAAGVENNRLSYGTAGSDDMRKIVDASGGVKKLPIFMTEKPVRIEDVEGAITTMVTRNKCEVIFVDYLQLIHGPHAHTKEQEIATTSMTLKNLGKTLGATIVVAAQLSRASETGGIRRPTQSDLRHSGQIEQDGDLILLLHREDYYEWQKHPDPSTFRPTNVLEIIVAKNKGGPVGFAQAHFEGKYQTVTDIPKPVRAKGMRQADQNLVDSLP